MLRFQPGQIANPKRLGASRDECHRAFVVETGADRQSRKLQRNATGNSLHARIERLVLDDQCLPVDSCGVRDLPDRWASAVADQDIRQHVQTSRDDARVRNGFDSFTYQDAQGRLYIRVIEMPWWQTGIQTVIVETPRIKRTDGKHEDGGCVDSDRQMNGLL